MTQRDEIINLMDFLDDQLDEREMELLVNYFYALSLRSFDGHSIDEINSIRSLRTDWFEVLEIWLSYREEKDNSFALPFTEGGK